MIVSVLRDRPQGYIAPPDNECIDAMLAKLKAAGGTMLLPKREFHDYDEFFRLTRALALLTLRRKITVMPSNAGMWVTQKLEAA